MSPLGVSKTVLLGVLSHAPQLHYGRENSVRALLSLLTRVPPVGAQGEMPGIALDDAHLVYCEGGLAERMIDLPSGSLVYLEGRNREQRMTDPSGRSHRLAYVSASIVRCLNAAPSPEGANSVTLVATVMREPIPKLTSEGTFEHVKLRVSTTHRQPDENGEPKYTREFHWVTFYGRVAEFVFTRAREGSLVYIEGRNQPSKWTDGDGLNHRTIMVVGHYLQVLQLDQVADKPAPSDKKNEPSYGYDVQLPKAESPYAADRWKDMRGAWKAAGHLPDRRDGATIGPAVMANTQPEEPMVTK